jgi:hypothetical protein
MLNDILKAADIPAQAARFPNPPDLHAVYFDSTETEGPDIGESRLVHHDCTVELYAPSIEAGDKAKHRLTSQLEAHSIRYTTQGWYWLSATRRYQEIIEFSHIEKT